MSDRSPATLSLADKDALVFQNRSQTFAKDATTFAIDPLGKIAVLCGKRGLFFVRLDEEKLEIFRTVRDTKNAGKDISGVRWSRNPNILASTCLQELSLWDINSTSAVPLLSKVACHRRAITGFDWSNHQDNVVATCSYDSDSLVYLWDLRDMANPVRFHALRSPFGGASAVKWSRREEHYLAASNGSQLLIWDVRKEAAPLFVIPADLKPLVDFDWSYRDDLTVLTCAPGSVKFWNLNNPRKALGALQTAAVRARFNPFSRSCITLTGQPNHSWDLWNIADIATPFLTKEYGIEDWPQAKNLGALSKFNWRRVLVGSSFEYQLVSWSNKDQLLSLWRIGAEELEGCGVEPSKLNKFWSAKHSNVYETASSDSPLISRSHSGADLSIGANSSGNDDAASSSSGTTYDSSSSMAVNFASSPSGSEFGTTGSDGKWETVSVDSSSETDSNQASIPGLNANFSLAMGTGASVTSRARASSNSAALGVPASNDLTSPPGSFKLVTSPTGSKRMALNNAPASSSVSGRSSTLSRPVSFDVEIDTLMRHPMVGLQLTRVDKISRMVLFCLELGKAHVEVKITFPTLYPNGAPPSFTVVTNTSATSTVKTKEILVETAEELVSMNRNCLAPTFSKLIEYLSTLDKDAVETPIETNSKEHEEAMTKRRPSLTLSSPGNAATAGHLQPSSSNHGGVGHSPRHLTGSGSSASNEFTEYIVKPTDSLAAIALFFNMTVGELRKLNKIQHSVQLLPGQVLLVKRLGPIIPTPITHNALASPSTSVGGLHAPIHAVTTAPVARTPNMRNQGRATIQRMPDAHFLASLAGEQPSGPGSSLALPPAGLHNSVHGSPSHHHHERATSDDRSRTPSAAIPLASRAGRRGLADDKLSASPSLGSSFLGSPSNLKSRKALFEGHGATIAKEEPTVHVMRCKFVDRSTNPPQLVEGLFTATPSNLFFEPDLDQPPVIQMGALHYSIYLEMKKVREASDLKSMNLSLSATEDCVYLQILTKDRQPINGSKVLLFLGHNQSKVDEISQAMTRWIDTSSEKHLVDALGLDISGSFTATSDLAARANRHVAGDIMGRAASTLRESGINIRASGMAPISPPAASSSGLPSAKNNPSHDSTPAAKSDVNKHLGPPPTRPAAVPLPSHSPSPLTPATPPLKASSKLPVPKLLPGEDIDDLPQLVGAGGELLTTEIVWSIRAHLPMRFKYENWRLSFSTAVHGTSLLTFYKQLDGKQPTVLVVRDTDGHVFGAYASEHWHISTSFFGTGECFLFSILPTFSVYTWTGADDFLMIARRDFVAMGGGGASGRYGLWLDQELSAGTSEVCKTFLNRRLSLNEEFKCSLVEVYSLEPK